MDLSVPFAPDKTERPGQGKKNGLTHRTGE